MSVCLDCGASTADGIMLCQGHEDEWSGLVATAPGLLAELETTRLRLGRVGERGGRHAANHPLPWDDRASRAWRSLADELTTSARSLGWGVPGEVAPDAACAWLYGHVGAVRASPDAGRILSRLRSAYRSAERAVDRPPAHVFAGPCWGCARPLYVPAGAMVAVCPGCREPHDVAKLRDHLLHQAEDRLGTITECAAVITAWAGIPVSVDAVQGYVRRGELIPRGHVIVETRMVARYRFGDVLDLARRAQRRRPNQPRRRIPEQTPPRGVPTPA